MYLRTQTTDLSRFGPRYGHARGTRESPDELYRLIADQQSRANHQQGYHTVPPGGYTMSTNHQPSCEPSLQQASILLVTDGGGTNPVAWPIRGSTPASMVVLAGERIWRQPDIDSRTAVIDDARPILLAVRDALVASLVSDVTTIQASYLRQAAPDIEADAEPDTKEKADEVYELPHDIVQALEVLVRLRIASQSLPRKCRRKQELHCPRCAGINQP